MIIYKGQNGQVELKAIGSDAVLFADTMVLIKKIYTHLKMVDDELAEGYKNEIVNVLSDRSSCFYREVQEKNQNHGSEGN